MHNLLTLLKVMTLVPSKKHITFSNEHIKLQLWKANQSINSIYLNIFKDFPGKKSIGLIGPDTLR